MKSNAFTLATANNVTAANYTSVAKIRTNISRNLTASSRDAYGEIIREGVDIEFIFSLFQVVEIVITIHYRGHLQRSP
ncbi:hypothetical protein KHA80_13370 [Anaerobacillus sp. HL2]|nr:hypothetical protein KHA80_13370 [Anaerobacillus sp. HL2]